MNEAAQAGPARSAYLCRYCALAGTSVRYYVDAPTYVIVEDARLGGPMLISIAHGRAVGRAERILLLRALRAICNQVFGALPYFVRASEGLHIVLRGRAGSRAVLYNRVEGSTERRMG